MAKGNLFQGQARGKIGDVVFSRLNGQQISRVRNRNPRNPNSPAQRIQRAVMASVLQAYSAGKSILDHSFEGYSVGLQNMRRFLKLNTRYLRTAVLADLAAGRTGAACEARVTGRAVNAFVPWKFVVSEGTLTQNAFNSSLQAPEGYELEEWLVANSIRKDDIFTLLVYQCLSPDTQYNTLYIAPGATDYYGKVGRCKFSYLQLKVKDISSLTEAQLESGLTNVSYNDIFDVVAMDGIVFNDDYPLTTGILTGDTLPLEGSYYASGVVRSRESSGQRSNCVLEFPTYISGWAAEFGLTSDWINTAWDLEAASADVEPNLILEGSNFSLAPVITPDNHVVFSGAQYRTVSGTLTDWPSVSSQVVGGSLGATISFKISVEQGFVEPVTLDMVSNIQVQTKLTNASSWSDWGTPIELSEMSSIYPSYEIEGSLPSSVPSGEGAEFRILVNGTQQGGVVSYMGLS